MKKAIWMDSSTFFDWTIWSGLAVAAACYFLYFNVTPKSWKGPHAISNRFAEFSNSCHLLMVFALSCIGGAYARLLEELEEVFKGEGQGEGHGNGHSEGHGEVRKLHAKHRAEGGEGMEQHFKQSQYLLCCAVCLFLVSSAFYQLAGSCHASELPVPHVAKCSTGLAVGMGVGMLSLVNISESMLVLTIPAVMLLLTVFESWAAGTTRGPVNLAVPRAGTASASGPWALCPSV